MSKNDSDSLTEVELEINGKKIKMKRFIENIMKNVLIGIITELKEIPEDFDEVRIHFKK
jgi:hypothetical protein